MYNTGCHEPEPLMLIRRAADLKPSDITPESRYFDRREFLAATGAIGAGAPARAVNGRGATPAFAPQQEPLGKPYGLQRDDKPTPWEDVTGHNNFYEFGTDKEDPKANAQAFITRPWTITVDRSEEHTSELQSLRHLVCRLLL